MSLVWEGGGSCSSTGTTASGGRRLAPPRGPCGGGPSGGPDARPSPAGDRRPGREPAGAGAHPPPQACGLDGSARPWLGSSSRSPRSPAIGARLRLAGRLSLIGVRGYDKAFARVQRVVETELGLAAPASRWPTRRSRDPGGTPGGVSSKLEVALDARSAPTPPPSRSWRRLTAVDRGQPARDAGRHRQRVPARPARRRAPDARPAARAKAVFPPDELRALPRRVPLAAGGHRPQRDLDVYLLEFDEFARARCPRRSARDLEPLRALLTERRARERRRMVRALRSSAPRRCSPSGGSSSGACRLPEDDRPDAARPIGEVAARRIATVYRQMVKRAAAIDEDSPPEALHELRKKGKELRYLLEFFAGLFPAARSRPMVKTLKSLQDTLGRFQDREVQAAMLRSLGDESPRGSDGAGRADGDGRARRAARDAAGRGARGVRRALRAVRRRRRARRGQGDVPMSTRARHLQHQGRGRQDLGGGQPRLPRRARRRADAAVGPRPAGREHLPVPRQAEGQGRRAASSCAARATSTR